MRKLASTVMDVLKDLPREVREALGVVTIVLAKRPGPEEIALGIGADFRGACVRLEPRPYVDEDSRRSWIYVFTANIKPLTPENVQIVLLHEIGHALGMDEAEVHAIGLGSEAIRS